MDRALAYNESLAPLVTVRYWAAARAAAGVAEECVAGHTVGDVLAAAEQRRAGDVRFEKVLAISSILLADQPIPAQARKTAKVKTDDVIEVLPPFAGG